MTIAEELASLSRSPQPVGIDVPLKHSGLDPKTLSRFHAWLKSAHDYDASLRRLLEDDTTAEVLAADILGASRPSPNTHRYSSPCYPLPSLLPTASPRTRQSPPLPRPPKQVGSGSFASRRPRLAPRTPISVNVPGELDEVPLASATVRQGAADVGMVPYDSWAGKKTG